MAKYCRSCGKPVADHAQYCRFCGARIAAPQTEPSASLSPGPPRRPSSWQNPKPKPKKSGNALNIVLTVFLVIQLAVAGFRYPGFLRRKPGEEGGKNSGIPTPPTLSDTPKPESPVKPGDLDPVDDKGLPPWPWTSDPVDETPVEGIHIHADANMLYEDTELKLTPVTEASDRIMEMNASLQENGQYMVYAYEMDAGLEEGTVLPGEYQVEIDLEAIEVPEELYENCRIVRLDDEGRMFEMDSEVNGKVISYSTDSNSIMAVVIVPGVTVGGALVITGLAIAGSALVYGWEVYQKQGWGGYCYADGQNEYGEYRVRWKMSHFDPDKEERVNHLAEMENAFRQKAQEDYDAENRIKTESRGSLYWLFHENKSVARRLDEMKQASEEYQTLLKEIEVPVQVQEVSKRIETAFHYLGYRESIKMPKHRVEFMIKPQDEDKPTNLGTAVNPYFAYSYVNLFIREPELMTDNTNNAVAFRDNLLLTITHELFHICQERYHLGGWTDINRFDEMTAVALETDAREYYEIYDQISTIPTTTESNNWCTLIVPIDSLETGHTGKNAGQMRHDFLQAQGYLLSRLIHYLREKTGKKVRIGKIMKARASWKKATTSDPLKYAFELREDEFDTFFRLWCRTNTSGFSESMNSDKEAEFYSVQNKEILLKDNTGEHASLYSPMRYAAGVRSFIVSDEKPAATLLVKDPKLKETYPETDLIALSDAAQATRDGFYLRPWIRKQDGKIMKVTHRFMELYGDPGKEKGDYSKGLGYTVYAVTAPKKPELAQLKTKLSVRLPKPAGAAADGFIDGMTIYVENESGKPYTMDVLKENLGKEQLLDLAFVQPEGKDTYELSVKIEEYVFSDRGEKLPMPQSEPAVIRIQPEDQETISTPMKLQYDSLCSYSSNQFNDAENVSYTLDSQPGGNTVTVSGDHVTISLSGVDWSAYGTYRRDPDSYINITQKRTAFTVSGVMETMNGDGSYNCRVTSAPGSVSAEYNIDMRMFDPRIEETTTSNDWKEFELTSIRAEDSRIKVRIEDGRVVYAEVTLSGTKKETRTQYTEDLDPVITEATRPGSIMVGLE